MKSLDEFVKKKRYLICVDSDGCAMDTMDVKHIRCFGPCMVKEWGLEEWQDQVLERWNEINLYSMTRGINRFLALAQALTDYTIFYNGPKCGASAPDHAHFQAGNKGFMPIEKDWHGQVAGKVADHGEATLWYLNDAPRATLVIEAANKKHAAALFDIIYHSLDIKPGDDEPMMNVLAWYEDEKWIVCVFPREKHRPACYTAEGDANLLSSPASVDLGGVFITPVEKDFLKITAEDIAQILSEVSLSAEDFHRVRQRIKEKI